MINNNSHKEHPIVQTIKSRMVMVKSLDDLTYMDLSDIECECLPVEARLLLEKCKNIYQLNLSNCGLVKLDNLPSIQLTILLLKNNKIADC